MGVDTRFYVVHGIEVPYGADLANDLFEHNDYADGESEIDFVVDQMMGNYIVLGNILYSAEEEDNPKFRTLDWSDMLGPALKYKESFIKAFPQHAELMKKPFELMAFVHCY
jgi:hypothetical protein